MVEAVTINRLENLQADLPADIIIDLSRPALKPRLQSIIDAYVVTGGA